MSDLLSIVSVAVPVIIALHVWLANEDDDNDNSQNNVLITPTPFQQGVVRGADESKTIMTQGWVPHEQRHEQQEDGGFEVTWRGSLIATTNGILT
jgi:hypothetical protein